MFTPPSSPPPPRQPGDLAPSFTLNQDAKPPPEVTELPVFPPPDDRKRAWGRRTTTGVIIFPLLLVLITATTRFLTHPAVFDIFSTTHIPDWRSTITDWKPHKRHPDGNLWAGGEPTTASGPIQFPTGTIIGSLPTPTPTGPPATEFPTGPVTATTTVRVTSTTRPPSHTTTQALPTVPMGPVDVPTPFPQPFDTALQQNFSTVGCYNFFLNMTNSISFRSCRPFSLLLQSSHAFIDSQTNITLLNSIVWGMCNTQITQTQCVANMGWFASSLQSDCQEDLNDRNAMSVSTLTALQAFPLMQNTGCLVDPSTNTYCYVEAAYNSNPSDLYFYQLPLGISLPNSTRSTCSGCTKTIMGLYFASLRNSSQADNVRALQTTYPGAARLANSMCGSGYASTSARSSSPVAVTRPHFVLWTGAALLALVCSLWRI